MYLLAPFILQNFKKILRADPELWGCAIFGPKMAHLSWTKIFWYKLLLLLSSTYWPFSLCKIQNYGDLPFLGTRMVHLPQTIFFFGKLLLSFSSTYYPLSLCKIKKNSSGGFRVMRICNFWAHFPNWAFFFFQKSW